MDAEFECEDCSGTMPRQSDDDRSGGSKEHEQKPTKRRILKIATFESERLIDSSWLLKRAYTAQSASARQVVRDHAAFPAVFQRTRHPVQIWA